MSTRPVLLEAPTLLEREAFLRELNAELTHALAGQGRLVLIAGEAGVGKTALVRVFCGKARSQARVLEGACDALFTPRPLGPIADVAAETGGRLAERVAAAAAPHEVAGALLEVLSERPAVLVIEDAQWADEATLDVLRLLGRRIESTRALALVTFRDDELDPLHPVRVALGDLASAPGVRRVALPPLSLSAVRVLSVLRGVDPQALYRRTGGNPFFVTEVLAAGGEEIPATVRDAVLARAARLSPEARRLLDVVALVPGHAELWLLETAVPRELTSLAECLSSGVLQEQGGGVAFRHELARQAFEEAIPPQDRRSLHRALLAALSTAGAGAPDHARLAHHADRAGDTAAVLEHAQHAAEHASALGAHREAAAQYARALRCADSLPLAARADLLERRSYECYVTDQFDEAIESQERALEAHEQLGDPRRQGDALRSLSRLLRFVGRTVEAFDAARQAVALLESVPPGRELGMAYNNLSHLHAAAADAPETVAWGSRALELGQRLDDVEIVVYAHTNLGAMSFVATEDPAELELTSSSLAQRVSRNMQVARSCHSSSGPFGSGRTAWPTATSPRGSSTAPSAALICGASTCSAVEPASSSTRDAGRKPWRQPSSSCDILALLRSPVPMPSRCWDSCAHGGEIRTSGHRWTRHWRWRYRPESCFGSGRSLRRGRRLPGSQGEPRRSGRKPGAPSRSPRVGGRRG